MASAVQAHLAVVKYWNTVGGLYIWEFFTTLDYEWRVIRGHLPYRWTIWIYSLTRVAALVGVTLSFVIMDTMSQINCQLFFLFAATFLCLSAISASLLILFRSIAIWNGNKIVMTLVMMLWGTSIALHLQNITRIRYAWDHTELACVDINIPHSVPDFIPSIIAGISLLLFILSGLLILHRRGGGTFGLSRLLWKQGVIWLALGFAAVVPQLVFTVFHLNVSYFSTLLQIFWTPGLIVMTIAATRMHRCLVNFASGSSDEAHDGLQVSSLVFSKTKWKDTPPTAPDQIETGVDPTLEQHSTGDEADDDSSTIISTTEQVSENVGDPSRLNLAWESTCPLPAGALSPIPQTQTV